MACNCHGRNGERVTYASPMDQCTMCARKHVKNAWNKWNEFTYEEDNRDYVSAQLRDAADHLKISHYSVALNCRDLAIAIEENRDREYGDIGKSLYALLLETRLLFYAEHPESKKRLEELKKQNLRGNSCRP